MVLLRAHHEPPSVFRHYRAADVCYVRSLDDGMNLVAKEFVAALEMPAPEQRERMRAMRSLVAEFNVYRWAGRMLVDAARVRGRERLYGRLLSRLGRRGANPDGRVPRVRPAVAVDMLRSGRGA